MGNGEARADPRGVHHALAPALPDAPLELGVEELRACGQQWPLSYLVHRCAGQPAVVIGGGMSLKEQMERVPGPDDAVYISANAHGVKYWPCHLIVCLDEMEGVLRPYGVPIATSRRFGEIRIFFQRMNQSGMVGAYVAWVMGCSPILLCGMDCYVGGTYHDAPGAKSTGTRIPFKSHTDRWQRTRELLRAAGQYADVRSLGGPLVDEGIFPLHDPAAPAGPPALRELLLAEVGGVVVEFLQRVDMKPIYYQKGDIGEISFNEAKRLRAQRSVRILGEIKSNDALRQKTRPARRRAPALH